MELMSSVLLFALVVFPPQTLGMNTLLTGELTEHSETTDVTKIHKKILIKNNISPLVNKVNELQNVLLDPMCKHCLPCMELAIKAHVVKSHILFRRPSYDEMHKDLLKNGSSNRRKRDLSKYMKSTNKTTSTKKPRSKRTKIRKVITVTKYNDPTGQPIALKVKEAQTVPGTHAKDLPMTTTCNVFSVINTFPCNSIDGELLLSQVKRQDSTKKSRKMRDQTTQTTFSPQTSQTVVFKKRDVYPEIEPNVQGDVDSDVPENYMSSIETTY